MSRDFPAIIHPRLLIVAVLPLLAVLSLVAAAARGVETPPQNGPYEIPLRKFDLFNYRSSAGAAGRGKVPSTKVPPSTLPPENIPTATVPTSKVPPSEVPAHVVP